ncbi:MAG: amidohydrolase family protein [Sedimentisphaeraceae bacterium JB056]
MMNRRDFFTKSAVSAIALSSFCENNVFAEDNRYDILIKNGTVIDGSGIDPFISDIAIKDDRISEIAHNLPVSSAKKVIEAKGLTVCPGFIDIHTHSSGGALSHNYICQGVTTEIGGNCGKTSVPSNSLTLDEQLSSFEKKANLTNFGTLVGHAALRNMVMGLADRAPTSEELGKMKAALSQSLEQGAYGLSSGLEYAPGIFSDIDEMIALCEVVKQHDGIYASHMRDQKLGVLNSVKETIEVAKKSGVRIEISHLKMKGSSSWHLLDDVLSTIKAERESGVDVLCDVYPYAAMMTFLSIMFPGWARAGDSSLLGKNSNLIRRLKDSSLDAKLRKDTEALIDDMNGPQNIIVNSVSIADRAKKQNKEPYDVMKQLIIQSNGGIGMIGFAMSEENVKKTLEFPLTTIASDGWGQGSVGSASTHPRSYGTFPRVLGHYVRNEGILSLKESVRKMTSMPAEHFRIKDRGVLSRGKYADITIIDSEKIIDTADFGTANKQPEGVCHVIVNGKLALENGAMTGAAAGKILRR